jgi:hypothetical protein
MTDLTEGALQQELDYAKSIGNDTLQQCIDRIKQRDNDFESDTQITRDFAPHSFYFVRMKDGEFRGNGGIIFHGKHDGFGNGGAPTFSVSIGNSRETRWEIHT